MIAGSLFRGHQESYLGLLCEVCVVSNVNIYLLMTDDMCGGYGQSLHISGCISSSVLRVIGW